MSSEEENAIRLHMAYEAILDTFIKQYAVVPVTYALTAMAMVLAEHASYQEQPQKAMTEIRSLLDRAFDAMLVQAMKRAEGEEPH